MEYPCVDRLVLVSLSVIDSALLLAQMLYNRLKSRLYFSIIAMYDISDSE